MLVRLRERFGTNSLIGIFLIVMLFTFAGDETLRFLATQVPGLDESTPCAWLKRPTDLANNQSLIGRTASTVKDPIGLRVRASPIPQTNEEEFVIRILVVNETLGTVPFVYNPDEVIVGDNGTSGLGVTFNPPSNLFTPGVNLRNDPPTYPSDRLRVLGPQQQCLHRLVFTRDQLDANILNGTATLQAYYRGTNAGQVPQVAAPQPTPIYPDQGLYTGVITSPIATIPEQRTNPLAGQ